MRRYEVGTDGTTITSFDYDASTVTKDDNGFATIDFKITGSFGTKPDVKAFCEGSWISRNVTCSDPTTDGTVTGSVKVKPTTAYVDDDANGKLTLYVPYYGNTGIGQVTLTAKGSASLGVTSKEGNDTKVTIEVGSNETPGTGERLTVKAMHDDGTPVAWLHMGAPATKSDGKITQELKLDEYILAAEEASNASPRECTIAIYSPSGREVGRQRIVQNPIINLASKESANCYIISSPGRYMLPARKGNSNTALWSSRPSNINLTKPTDDGKNVVNYLTTQSIDGEDYVIFNVPNAVTNGNTVIALNSGSTLWSWHLWFSQANDRPDSESTLERYPDINGNFNQKRVMNRALGATTSDGINLSTYGLGNYGLWQDGFYYQWGRKDPLNTISATTSKTGGTYDTAKQNPAQFYSDWAPSDDSWHDGKSLNDPCPPGYKVPSSTLVWREDNPDKSYAVLGQTLTTGDRFTYNTTANVGESYPSTVILYPYGGYYNADGSYVLDKTESTDETTTSGYSYGYNDDVKVGDKSYAVNIYSALLPIQITDVHFRFKTSLSQGAFWANESNMSMRYGYEGITQSGLFSDIEIISFKYKTATVGVTSSGRFIKTYEVTSVTWSGEQTATDIDALTSSSENWSLAIGLMKEDLQSNYKAAFSDFPYDIDDSLPKASALQIRCVKEKE